MASHTLRATIDVRLLAVCLIVGLLQAAPLAAAAPGALDPAFGTGGKLITDVTGGDDRALGMAIARDGKAVAAGGTNIVRYNPGGTLDTGFGIGGKVTSAVIDIHDVAVQASGKLVVAGQDASGRFAVARYHPGGTLDTGFGTGGVIATLFPAPSPVTPEAQSASAQRVAIQADGKLVASGVTQATQQGDTRYGLAVIRLTPDGAFDVGFGVGGRSAVGSRESGGPAAGLKRTGLALLTDGRIMLASASLDGDFFLARFLTTGQLDASFSGDGKVRTNFVYSASGESYDSANDVVIHGGRILAGGATRHPVSSRTDFALARYNLDGTLDKSFGVRGRVVSDFGSSDAADPRPDDLINRLAITGSGKIMAAGCASSTGGCAGPDGDFALAAYQPNGAVDGTFGSAGRVTTPFGPGLDVANDIAIQPADGKLLTAGQAFNGTVDFALARYLPPVPPASAPARPGPSTPSPTLPDTTRPILSSLSLSPTRFRAARSGPRVSARVGSRVSYRLSEVASVRFRVERAFRGRRVGRRCLRPTRSNRTGRRCTRYVTLRGRFTHRGRAGSNRLRFTGRIRGRRLRPGRYRLRALATDAASNRSAAKRKGFKILRR